MPFRFILKFIKLESSSGIILFFAAAMAMIVSNTPLNAYYTAFQTSKSVIIFINDACMSVFFLLVGLEIKRELLEGELNSFSKAILPGISAIGGMLAPAIIYLILNRHDSVALRGWAIPTATDIAFSLGILSLLGKRIPTSLKIFLMALAIFDDLGAIIVIAIFYTLSIHILALLSALFFAIILFLMNYFNVKKIILFLIVGLFLWFFIFKSGIHVTIAGVIVALCIPAKNADQKSKSPLQTLEHVLHPWVSFGILPLFAFANAGVSFSSNTFTHLLLPIPMGIAGGLLFGKMIGIYTSTLLAVKLKLSLLPRDITKVGLFGMSLIAGVGFTMSLFIGGLAFGANIEHAEYVRIGVLIGSMMSGLLGYFMLCYAYKV
ncbi:MAG: Na+/H+ antiporter NhaA [Coxiellaceae bacterium]|nr:Na+/H+ antiporter NhaA [Coxiellaceae bacterium]